jgi:cytochrome b pre-mRNA-processing protein 3
MFKSALGAGFARRRELKAEADALYAALVRQARQPSFYRGLGVPDSFDARFDLLIVHAYLVFRRLRGDEGGKGLAQAVFDVMFADMDDVLREQGVGDMSIARKIRSMGEAFYGRSQAYDAAFSDEAALGAALVRNVWRGAALPSQALPLARYMKAAEETLAQCALPALAAGEPVFPTLP